jgi:hypothetical protein
MTKLTTAYIRKIAQKDKRIDQVEIYPEDLVAVWLDPKYTWCANDGNRSVNIYNVEYSDYQDSVSEFLSDVKNIELSVEWTK